MERIGIFFQIGDFIAMNPQTYNLSVVTTIKNLVTRLSLLLPGRLPHTSFSTEIVGPIPIIDYGLVSYYSGNWSAPRRNWFGRNLTRIDIMRYTVKSTNEGSSKVPSMDKKEGNTSCNPSESQLKIKSEGPKISDVKFKDTHSSSLGEIIDMGAKLEKAKAKEYGEKIEKVANAVNASSFAKLQKLGAKASGTSVKIDDLKIDIKASGNDTKLKKEDSVAEKKLGVMQAKLGVVEAKLSEAPQVERFSEADYALKTKELLKEISRRRRYKQRKKTVVDNANESGFFKRINKLRLEKWKRFPKARLEDTKGKHSTKNKEPKN